MHRRTDTHKRRQKQYRLVQHSLRGGKDAPVAMVHSTIIEQRTVWSVLLCTAVYNVGTPAPDTCGQTVNSIESGVLLSPTYPGMYPDHIFCFYKIHGMPGQRVKLTFTDIDLYSGGEQ